MRRGYLDLPAGQVHYIESGSGAPLILLHRSPRSARDWWRLMPLLAPRYRVIALDTLGFGRSDPLPAGATMEHLAGVVAAAIAALGLERAHVFGLHTGNKIGAALGADFGGCVDKLILCGQNHSIIPEKAARDAAIHGIVDAYFVAAGGGGDGSGRLRPWAADFTNLTKFWWHAEMLAQVPLTEDHLRHMEYEALDYLECRRSIQGIYRANFAFDFGAAIRRIARSTLVLELTTRAEDHLGCHAARVQALIPGSRAATIDGYDGDIVFWQPAALAAAIGEFLG
ncbi:MAG: alpha/beta hydrolase [Alphaproteobacteria bacterium]|nr:alpha/beta hydrolase [Alphaproteobacteria bacterium]